jgi:putative hydrolase of the HAD superfamily
MKIETVFFDFGGTLAYEYLSHADSMYDFLFTHGIDTTTAEVAEAERAMREFGDAWVAEHGRSKTLADRFWYRVCLAFAERIAAVPDSQDLAEFLHASYDIIPYKLYEDTVPALEALKGRGLTLGVISNWDAPTIEIATRRGSIRPYFDMVLSSRNAECEKPGPEIFHEACRRAGADRAKSMHVGDSIEADIVGAKSVGITPVWINRDGADADPGSAIVQQLTEIPALIDRLES